MAHCIFEVEVHVSILRGMWKSTCTWNVELSRWFGVSRGTPAASEAKSSTSKEIHKLKTNSISFSMTYSSSGVAFEEPSQRPLSSFALAC